MKLDLHNLGQLKHLWAIKLFHSVIVVCREFSRMLISRSHRGRLIMQPSLPVKFPAFIFGIAQL